MNDSGFNNFNRGSSISNNNPNGAFYYDSLYNILKATEEYIIDNGEPDDFKTLSKHIVENSSCSVTFGITEYQLVLSASQAVNTGKNRSLYTMRKVFFKNKEDAMQMAIILGFINDIEDKETFMDLIHKIVQYG